MRNLGILILLILIILPTSAQSTDLNIGARPRNSPEPVLSAEIWDRLGLDYFTILVEVDKLAVDAMTNMSALAPNLPTLDECVGNVPAQPTYTIQWDRAQLEEVLPMAFYMQGNQDTIMILREPDGDWHCANDFDNTQHPYISIESLRSGAYEIWVGTESDISSFTGSLYITISDDNPSDAPRPCCDGLAFSNPAQSETGATITYFEVDALHEDDLDASGILLSTDIIFRGDGGTSFTVEVLAFDSASHEEIALVPSENPSGECEASVNPCDLERIRRDASRRDYSSRRGPVNFEIETIDLEGLGEDYYFEVVVTTYTDDADPKVVDTVRIESTIANTP